MTFANHFSALLITGASLLIGLLVLGLWRICRERFLLLAGLAQLLFAAHHLPLFFAPDTFAHWAWRATFAALFGVYAGITAMVVNLLLAPPSRALLQLTKLYLWLVAPLTFFIFGVYDFTAYITSNYAHYQLTANNLVALLVNAALAVVVVRKYWVLQTTLLQTRMDASFQIERAKLLERQRIMSDIHDTVGSQLVGMLALIRGGAAPAQLEGQTMDVLQELRIAIDAIQPVNGSLTVVLATLRHRLQPRLEAAGLKLIWRMNDLPRMDHLTPPMVQHIQRIVMEAFSNIIQHAKASSVTVAAQHLTAPDCVEVTISDDGIGFNPRTQTSTGQGLSNLDFRAREIGAVLHIERHQPHGTIVRLTLPAALNSMSLSNPRSNPL